MDKKKTCKNCKKELVLSKFAKGNDEDGYDFWCSVCRKSVQDVYGLKEYCEANRRGFSVDLWNSSVLAMEEKYKDDLNELKGKDREHLLNIRSINNYFRMMNLENLSKESPTIINNSELTSSIVSTKLDKETLEYLEEKWGAGYSTNELIEFEKKYNLLKNNYPEKTAMHSEALKIYVRYRVKEEYATAKGDVKSAKLWGELASKQAQDAKINPSQLSKADLSDGLDTFGQLVRSVEQAVDIIPILPKFKMNYSDLADFTMLCYFNYIRDLKGLPSIEYKDVYNFLEERKKEFKDSILQSSKEKEDEE